MLKHFAGAAARRVFWAAVVAAAVAVGPRAVDAQDQAGQAFGDWRLVCQPSADGGQACALIQALFLSKEVEGQARPVGRVLNLTLQYIDLGQGRSPFLSLQMPLGVDLRPGAVMRVDDGQERPLQFLRCTRAGCDASVALTPELIDDMRRGGKLQVGFRAWGAGSITVVDASLVGFTNGFAQLR